MVLSAQNLGLSFGDTPIFSGVSFDIGDSERVGLIGTNGTGKTSLFKIICGELEASAGDVFVSKNVIIGNVEQHACRNPELTAYEEVLTVYSDVIETENELNRLRKLIENSSNSERDAYILRQDELREQFESRDGLTYKSRARSALLGLGFTENEINLRVGHLSGGQKTKVSLAKLLLSRANLILLDEPTNHLDMNAVEWLEDFLKKYNGAAIIISHDRYFLDRTTEKTIEIEHHRAFVTKGNYTRSRELKAQRLETERREYEKTAKEIKRIEGIIAQQKTFSMERNYITIDSKQKQIDRLSENLVKPESELQKMKLSFTISGESGNDVLFVENLSRSFGEKKLFDNLNMNVYKGERVFLLGPNGCGKSTLLKIIMGQLMSDSGRISFGQNTNVGYFEQVQSSITSQKTVLEEVYDRNPKILPGEIRNRLAALGFRGDDVFKRMSELSGGERAKVGLLLLTMKGNNVLLLDEPTNHLDIDSAEVLEQALSEYEGTLICVSHDRYFINKLASKLYMFSPDGFKKIDGNYDTYKELLINSTVTEKEEKTTKVNDYKLKKEQASLERKRQTRIAKIEEELEAIEIKREEFNGLLNTPEISADYIKIAEITENLDKLQNREDELFSEWETLQ